MRKIVNFSNNIRNNTWQQPIPPIEIDHVEVRFSISPNVPTIRIDDVDNLKFRLTEKEGKNCLSEIIMVVSANNINEAVSKAMNKVRPLCNLISFKCKQGVVPAYVGASIMYKDGTSSARGERSLMVWDNEDLELEAREINNIENDPKNLMYARFSRSFIALLSYHDHATVIKELYQILEDDNRATSPNLVKYRHLRNALSHGNPLTPKTLQSIENEFGKNYFVFKDGRFDYGSLVNTENLRAQAWDLMMYMLKEYRKI
jgi:hypothetical protein